MTIYRNMATQCFFKMAAIAVIAVCAINGKILNGSRYYRALESVSIASALSTALTLLKPPIQQAAPSTNRY